MHHREGFRFPPERRHVLREEERRQRMPPEPILAAAHVQSGETVVDLGAGTGYWTEPLARLVGPQGKVFAVDVEPVMLEELRTLSRDQNLHNVEVIHSAETSVPLASNIADLVVLGFVLHEPAEPEIFLQEIIRLLKPTGRVLVLDWQKRPTEQGPPLEHRISEEEAQALLEAAGLAVERLLSPSEDIYTLLADEFRPGDLQMDTPTV